jgi:hypothetical protein
MSVTALPGIRTGVVNPADSFVMPELLNTSTVDYRRVIQSLIIYNNSNIDSLFVVRVGGNTIYKETLKPAQTFTLEGVKLTQLGSSNTNTVLSVVAVTANSELNVVVSFTTLTFID